MDDNKADRNVPNQDYKHKEKLGAIQGEDNAQNVEENTEQVCNTATTSETSSTRIKSIAGIYICITMFIEVRGGLRCRIDLMVGMTVGFKARNIENVLHCSSERVTL